ncbi:MAG: nucleotidyltransferase domain-containing protein [Chloroflexi bacterium]|nr:nucleotidyltransferase domain-containing protein [Chloroflexota bacterium]
MNAHGQLRRRSCGQRTAGDFSCLERQLEDEMKHSVKFSRANSKKLGHVARRYRISLVIAFGSRARGDARAFSDLDLGVLFDQMPSPRQLSALEARLLDLIQDDVHLVPLNFANPELRVAAAREGQILYQRDASDWVRFVIRNIHLLHDVRRLRQYDDDLIRRFLERRPNDKNLQRRGSKTPARQSRPRPRAA